MNRSFMILTQWSQDFPRKRVIQSFGVIYRPADIKTSDKTVFEIISLSTNTPSQSKITKSGVMAIFP